MARSLVVKHEENPRTSSLFTGFLLLCGGFLLLGTAVAAASADDLDPGPSVTSAP
jgi:hypothetical protein